MTADNNANRDTAIELLTTIQDGGPQREVLAPDAVWWVPGRPEIPARDILGMMKGLMSEGRMEILGVLAEGDRVAVESRSFMKTQDGRDYSNSYHFLVEFRDGLVTRVKEYCDTAHVNAFFAGGT